MNNNSNNKEKRAKAIKLTIIIAITLISLVFIDFGARSEALSNLQSTIIDLTGLVTGDIATHDHLWVQKYNADRHWDECVVCGTQRNSATHSIRETGNKDICDSIIKKYCTSCGYSNSSKVQHTIVKYEKDNPSNWPDWSIQPESHYPVSIVDRMHIFGVCSKCFASHAYDADGNYAMGYCVDANNNVINCANMGICKICGCDYRTKNISHHNVEVSYKTKSQYKHENVVYKCKDCNIPLYEIISGNAMQSASNRYHYQIVTIYRLMPGVEPLEGIEHTWNAPYVELAGQGTVKLNHSGDLPAEYYNNAFYNTQGIYGGLYCKIWDVEINPGIQSTVRVNSGPIAYGYKGRPCNYSTWADMYWLSPDNYAPTNLDVEIIRNADSRYTREARLNVRCIDDYSDFVEVRLTDENLNELVGWTALNRNGQTFSSSISLTESEIEISTQKPLRVEFRDRFGNTSSANVIAEYIDTKAPILVN